MVVMDDGDDVQRSKPHTPGTPRRRRDEPAVVTVVGGLGSGAPHDFDEIVRLVRSAQLGADVSVIGSDAETVALRFDAISVAARTALADSRTTHGSADRFAHWAIDVVPDDPPAVDDVLERVASLCAMGHPGQVLLSDRAKRELAAAGSEAIVLTDLGFHRLVHPWRPERVWQLGAVGRDIEFPGLRPLARARRMLPSQVSALIGRQTEIDDIVALLRTQRLVTLTGVGGVGKTRLALAVAAAAGELLDVVCWAELAHISEPGAVPTVLLDSSGLGRDSQSPIERMASAFAGRRVLMVIDNAEHVLDAVAEVTTGLLGRAESMRVLVTSREPLRVPGESTWPVPPLACPDPSDHDRIDAASIAGYDAIMLFCDRAARADPSFRLDDRTAPTVATVCESLDGIPLAIELIASRCRHASVEQIATDVADRFRVLRLGTHRSVVRHRTLEASIDWSFQRLDEYERTVFLSAGLFTGPFPAEALEPLVAVLGWPTAGLSDTIDRLVDANLVVRNRSEADLRLLNVIRAYALARAAETGRLDELRTVHARWWSGWLEQFTVPVTERGLRTVERYFTKSSCRPPARSRTGRRPRSICSPTSLESATTSDAPAT